MEKNLKGSLALVFLIMAKYTFEEYLSFIEDQLGIQLLDYQKYILEKIYNSEYVYFIPARTMCRENLFQAQKILKELIEEET